MRLLLQHERVPFAQTTDGMRLHFEAANSGDPVVLLHPNNSTSRAWLDLGWFEALESQGYRPIALDARGFGASDDVTRPEQLWPGSASADVSAVLDSLGVDTAHVCGFSLGATMGLRFAYDQPTRVRSLVLGGLSLGPLVQMGLYLGPSPEQWRDQALTQLERLKHPSPRVSTYFQCVREVLTTSPLEPLRRAELRLPLLGVFGERDPLGPAAIYEELRATAENVPTRVEIIAQAGHGSSFIHPRFRELALAFFALHAA
jgi:pimeloyl-ACP methyl ester carboxylesterase